MTWDLAIGDRSYSSWSLRGWLLFAKTGIPVRALQARLYTEAMPTLLAEFPAARTVPAARSPEGHVIWDTLAIAEELHQRHPDAGLWPSDPGQRALARSIAAEMHSSFGALRNACPMNLRVAYAGAEPADDPAVRADVDRIETLWAAARREAGDGPWLFGRWSAADAFYAPVAARIAGYGLTVGPEAMAYVGTWLADPDFRRWRAQGATEGADQELYRRPWPRTPWPGPAPLPARAVDHGPSVNQTCPYSGKPVSHYLELDGRVWGFCNAACRDKTVADPGAWPKFMAIQDRGLSGTPTIADAAAG
jgi:glutathione S-transferase